MKSNQFYFSNFLSSIWKYPGTFLILQCHHALHNNKNDGKQRRDENILNFIEKFLLNKYESMRDKFLFRKNFKSCKKVFSIKNSFLKSGENNFNLLLFKRSLFTLNHDLSSTFLFLPFTLEFINSRTLKIFLKSSSNDDGKEEMKRMLMGSLSRDCWK